MPASPRPDWSGRLHRLREICLADGLGAFVVSTPANLRYLTGFSGSAGLLVLTAHTAHLLVDGRYHGLVDAGIASGDLAAAQVEPVVGRFDRTLAAVLNRAGAVVVGVEPAQVTLATLKSWQTAASEVEWRPLDAVVERLRMIKDDVELARIRRGATRVSNVARMLRQIVVPGRSERDIAKAIDLALEQEGFDEPAFPTIVASGPNGAHPHARPTDRRLETGDLVVLDFGGVLDGYCVDLTRTAVIGQVSARARALFAAVQEAQAAAIATVRAGVSGAAVDAAARRVLDARGLAAAFLHSTGHGLGVEVHEAPRLAPDTSSPAEPLEAGMVCTIEPGAYLEGFAGVRLEDDVLVTADGCEVLTDAPKDLLVV